MKLPLKGIIPPVVTPLIDNNTIDVEGLENLVEHLVSGEGRLPARVAGMSILAVKFFVPLYLYFKLKMHFENFFL